jgi:hypothetical protein
VRRGPGKSSRRNYNFFDLDSENHQRAGAGVHFAGCALRQVGEIQGDESEVMPGDFA